METYLKIQTPIRNETRMRSTASELHSPISNTLLLLTTKGRNGHQFEANLIVLRRDDDNYIVAATNESDKFKPRWHLNLKEEPLVTMEIDGVQIHAIASTPVGRERLRLWRLAEEIPTLTNQVLPRDTALVVLSPIG